MSIPFGSKGYENYVATREKDIPSIVRDAAYPTPALESFRSHWHTPGPTRSDVGMAEFTAQNFLSPRTAFGVNRDGALVPNPEFPLPASARIVTLDRGTTIVNGRVYSRDETLLVGDVFDPVRSSSTSVPLAQVSALQTAAQLPVGLHATFLAAKLARTTINSLYLDGDQVPESCSAFASFWTQVSVRYFEY